MDDIGIIVKFEDTHSLTNCYFKNICGAMNKHYVFKSHEIGAHLRCHYYSSYKKENLTGVFAGMTYRPTFFHPLRFITEYDDISIKLGADVLFWKRLFIQASLVH